MQEKLKVFSLAGEELLEKDLSAAKKPLMILAGETPQLVDTVPSGADVLGALVRDEDGWTLASAKSDMPVSSGPKKGPDFHLTAGIACSLGPWLFRIEREGSATGTVLLWKVGSSAVVADPLIVGRNVVSITKDGVYAVNAAVPGEELCDIFLATDGIEVVPVGSEGGRVVVPFATLFSSGSFQAMALDAADAALALKSGNPFSWSGKKVRTGVMSVFLLCGLVCLGALALVQKKASVDAVLAARQGAQEIERKILSEANEEYSDEDILVYKSAFFRSLPIVTGPNRSAVTRDLIKRGQQLISHFEGSSASENEKDVARMVAFLGDVDAIQAAIGVGDWSELKSRLAACDSEMFVRCDAEVFRSDAQRLLDFVTVELPAFMASVSKTDAGKMADLKSAASSAFDAIGKNIFMSGDVVLRERAVYEDRKQVLFAYVEARNAFLSSEAAPDAGLLNLWADFISAFDPEDEAFSEMVNIERTRLAEATVKRAGKIPPVDLARLRDLGAAVGVDSDRLSEWSAAEVRARKEILTKCRELYTEYRTRAAQSRRSPETLSVLDDIIALGLKDSTYYTWAVRERVRLEETKEEGK